MSAYRLDHAPSYVPSDLRTTSDPELVELSMLLPHWQLDALETAARGRGLTTGQMLRRVIGEFCTDTCVQTVTA